MNTLVFILLGLCVAVGSPKEGSRGLPDRRQSVAIGEGISHSAPPPSLRQQMGLQQSGLGQGEGSSLLNIMSSSAMTTGSNSSLRNVTVKKVWILCVFWFP